MDATRGPVLAFTIILPPRRRLTTVKIIDGEENNNALHIRSPWQAPFVHRLLVGSITRLTR